MNILFDQGVDVRCFFRSNVNAQDKAIEAAIVFAKRAPVPLISKYASDMMVMVIDKAFTQVGLPRTLLIAQILRPLHATLLTLSSTMLSLSGQVQE